MSHRIGSLGAFMDWTREVVRDPRRATRVPKRWFDSEATARAAAQRELSPEAMVKLLSRENLSLIRAIAERRPESIRALSDMVSRREASVSRTLKKLAAAGIVAMDKGPDRRLRPRLVARRVRLEIDFTSDRERGLRMRAEKIAD